MKKFLAAAMLLSLPFLANAQKEVGTFSIQPKMGINVSGLTNNPEIQGYTAYHKINSQTGDILTDYPLDGNFGLIKSESKVGFVFGAEAEYQASRRISLSAGVLYSMQGNKYTDVHTEYKDITNAKLELGYINVPITANYYIFKGLALRAGLQPGFCIHKKAKADISVHNKEGWESRAGMFTPDVYTIELSAPVGLSYEYKGITVGAMYNIGVLDVISGHLKYSNEKQYSRNSVFQFTLGYKIGL